jgi:hypothetical protein
MSKCKIAIEFDQTERTFNAGELITGKAYVTANADMPCNGVLIELAWATHGRGNHAGATISKLEYDGMMCPAGKTIAYEFRFNAPAGPLTYHGHYLNVDHYIKVRLDIPWALDPKASEEYILLPGPPRTSTGDVYSITKTGSSKKASGCAAAVAAVIVIMALLSGFIPVLIIASIAMAIMGFLAFRNSMAARKLGGVTMTVSRSRATPGEQLPVSIEFAPPKSVRISGATASLKGVENVVSGSGTKKTTHTKQLFEKHFILSEAAHLSEGRQEIAGVVGIPQTNAWTFHADDNKLTWEITVRIAIPGWPDWVDTAELELVPSVDEASGVAQMIVKTPPPPPLPLRIPIPEPTGKPIPPVIPTAAPVESTPPPIEPEAQTETPGQPDSASDARAYAADLNTIINADRFGSERDDLLAQAAERTYDLEVTIKSRSWTLESSLPLEYRNGRTIIAKVEDTDSAEIAVYLPENANKDIDAVSVGTTLRLTVRPRKFNKFYKRMEALAEKH